MKRIFFAFLFLILSLSVHASTKVPPNFQAVLLSKIIALDNSLQNSDKETLEMAVYYDSSNSASVKTKSDFIKVFQTLDMYGKPVDVTAVEDLGELANYDMIYMAEISDEDFDKIMELAVANKILTISADDEYARKGCALSFSVVGGKPKVLFNQTAVDEIGADFAIQVMLISEVI